MERVVTINLNGNPYQLDESAYDALRAYLARAEAALAANPDKTEIVRDLEQAVADKCQNYLSPHKTVVSAAEMTRMLEEMGPVAGEDSAEEGARQEAPRGADGASKRLYRIRDNAVAAGVCSGLGAYFDLDVNLIRLMFIIGFFVTGGALLLIYVVMMFLVPSAHTSEEWAAAHGVPFNAQEVIDRAKREYAHFTTDGPPWRWARENRRAWKRAMRERWRSWAHGYAYPPAPPAGPIGYGARIIGGFFAIIFGFVRAIVGIVFVAALFTLITTGSLGYWDLPPHIAMWQAVFVLVAAYVIVSIPLRALSFVAHSAVGGPGYHGYRGGEALITLAAIALAGWLAYLTIPEARDMMEHFPETLKRIGAAFAG